MAYGFVIPLPIVVTMLMAGSLSPDTNVPLGWVVAGFAASTALAWRAWRAHTKWMEASRATRERMGRMEKLVGDLARKVCELERLVEKK